MAAKDLYCSQLRQRRRSYAERSGRPWVILSAHYGLVEPEDGDSPLRPSPDQPADRSEEGVGRASCGESRFRVWFTKRILLRGSCRRRLSPGYSAFVGSIQLQPSLAARAPWTRPAACLVWRTLIRSILTGDATPSDVQRALVALGEECTRIAAKDWPGGVEGLDNPGLYSWWVDDPGARDLAGGGLDCRFPQDESMRA